jgi:ABC-type multidrug transport system permease subunit
MIMRAMLKHELIEFFGRPQLWLSVLAFGVFLVHVVAHLSIEEEDIRVAIYQTDTEDDERLNTIAMAESLVQEMSNIKVLERKTLTGDVASQLLSDNADIAITRTEDGWRFLVRSRSSLEHKRLVRMAQVLGASLSQQRPWPLIAYRALQINPNDDVDQNWPRKAQISGTSADPGDHARVFVPKTIALLSFMAAFAFACRSMIRDISNNTLGRNVVASHGSWLAIVVPKVTVATIGGLLAFLALLSFAFLTQGFYPKDGLLTITIFQTFGWITSALLGMICATLAQTESRIYMFGSGYLILLVLLSGLIAKISQKDVLLYWLSSILPLGYAMDVLSDWMFFGFVPRPDSSSFQIMLALLIVAGTCTFASVMWYQRRI